MQAVFVFSANLDDNFAFSLDGNGANLPFSAFDEPWLPTSRTRLNETSLVAFRVNAAEVAQALTREGFYLGRPLVREPWWSFHAG